MKSSKRSFKKIISKPKIRKTVLEFQKFAFRGNGMDVAVGMVIGTAFSTLIKTTVNDIVMPILGIFGKDDFRSYSIQIGNLYIPYGSVLAAFINFILIAFVVFMFVKLVNNVSAAKEEEEKNNRICPYCLSKIPREATRCAHCTSKLPKLIEEENQERLEELKKKEDTKLRLDFKKIFKK